MFRKLITSGCVLAALSWGATDVTSAQVRGDKAVYFTFSQPVTLPQVTLPAGKYLFRLADSLVNRTIVQIYSADGSKMHGMMMTIPVQRNEPPNDPEIRFLETAANQPPAIATYWYPGERTGWEFIYPREQATALAKAAKQPVLTTQTNATAEEMRTAELARVTPTGEQAPVGASSSATAAGATQRGEVAANPPAVTSTPSTAASSATASASAARTTTATTSPAPPASGAASSTAMQTSRAQDSAQAQTTRQPRTSLPATASWTPMVALVGILMLVTAFGLGLVRRIYA